MSSGKNEFSIVTDSRALARTNLTLSVVIMDCSGSMQGFESAPKNALIELVQGLQSSTAADSINVAIFGFSSQKVPAVIVPLSPVMSIRSFEIPVPNGGTRLYGTVLDVLMALERLWQDAKKHGSVPNVVVTVCTDGHDNLSQDRQPVLQVFSRCVRELGWDLSVFGYGVDAPNIARNMGFNDDAEHATTMDADEASIHTSMQSVTSRTKTTSMGRNWRPSPARPVTVNVREDTPPPSTPR